MKKMYGVWFFNNDHCEYTHSLQMQSNSQIFIINQILFYYHWLLASVMHLPIVCEVIQQQRESWCKMVGHDLVSDGYMTPDSGVEYIYCQHCCESHQIVWY